MIFCGITILRSTNRGFAAAWFSLREANYATPFKYDPQQEASKWRGFHEQDDGSHANLKKSLTAAFIHLR